MTDIPIIGQQAPPAAAPEPIRARTAYLVVIGYDGMVQFIPEVGEALNLILERHPTVDEIQSSAQIVHDDIVIRKTAGTVQQVMLQTGQAMAEAQANAALADKVRNATNRQQRRHP